MFRSIGLPAGFHRLKSRSAEREKRPAGFTLLEVLVAFTVLAFLLAPMLQVFSQGMNASAVARDYTIATLLARTRLEALGAEEPIIEGTREGRFDGRYRWRTAVQRDPESVLVSGDRGTIVSYRVAVTVAWGNDPGGSSVTLVSLRTTAAPPAPTTRPGFGRPGAR